MNPNTEVKSNKEIMKSKTNGRIVLANSFFATDVTYLANIFILTLKFDKFMHNSQKPE